MAALEEGTATAGGEPTLAALMRCVPGVRAVLLRLTRDLEATNDLAQDVALAAWLAIEAGRLRDPAALPAYLLQCARHAAAGYARKPRHATVEELSEFESAWAERPQTPLEHCEARELRGLAQQALADLPTERDRALIRGFYVEGRGKPELMAAFGLGADQFDRVISRARMRMRELLRDKLNAATPEVRESAVASVSSAIGTGGRP